MDLQKAMQARRAVQEIKELEKVRSYAAAEPQETSEEDDDPATEKNHRKAMALAIAAQILAGQYGGPDSHLFHELLDALHHPEEYEEDSAGDDERSYAAAPVKAKPGYVLKTSKRNPKVRRWVRVQAMKNMLYDAGKMGTMATAGHIGSVVGHNAGALLGIHSPLAPKVGGDKAWAMGSNAGYGAGMIGGAAVVGALHQHVERTKGLKKGDDSAFDHMHYYKHHPAAVVNLSKKLNVSHDEAARAMAHVATAHHAHGLFKRKVKHPATQNADYHKQLARRVVREVSHKVNAEIQAEKAAQKVKK